MRAAPIERRIYMRSSGWLPRPVFMALTRFMYGASPMKATLRRMLGRACAGRARAAAPLQCWPGAGAISLSVYAMAMADSRKVMWIAVCAISTRSV